ncbi:DUF6461 domain-containing protein [Amycolatopsis sp. NPDC023774]|uniref:DUF6461 domain-containing protein n=1 Tax=Amycolatopsis sp. NPDC023774 TaxID=3155015 RepID=UPI0033EF9F64
MQLPVPTVRPDAVQHYVALLGVQAFPAEALCLTAVRGLSVDEALLRFDGFPASRDVSLAVAGQISVNAFPDELAVVVADHRDGWTLLAENNGFHGSRPGVLARLSSGTVAASVYWNVNLASRATLAQDGKVLSAFDFVSGRPPEGETPKAIGRFLDDLDFDDPYRMCAAALAFLERVSGIRVTSDWSGRSHAASVIVDPTRFELPSSWLSINAPDIAAAIPEATRQELRTLVTLVATRACEAASVNDPAVLAALADNADALPELERIQRRDQIAVEAYQDFRHGLELRWNRCRPGDTTLDARARLRAAARRRNADTSHERAVCARAHALAAVCSHLADDPVDALARAMFNACQANRNNWPAMRDELTTRLLADGT